MDERKYAFAIEMATLAREVGDIEAATQWYAEAWKELHADDAIAVKFHPITDKRPGTHANG